LWIKKKEELSELVAKLKNTCSDVLMTAMKDYNAVGMHKPSKGTKGKGGPAMLSQRNLAKLNSLTA